MRQDLAQAWRARPVGSAASDIDLVFDPQDRPGTVTSLLAACVSDVQGEPVGLDEAWDWTLNQRLQALLAMRLASNDTDVELQASCGQCGETMAMQLDLRAFASEPVAPRFTWHGEDGLALGLRLPCGRDLQAWMSEDARSQEVLVSSLIESVAGPATALSELLPALDDAFEVHDPLTALRLHTACPACGHDNDVTCDLEGLLIDGFKRSQAAMLDDVVRLASAFHWREADILALPSWRRAHYLRQVTAGDWA
ncbi:MAG: hypothetical protein EOP38_10880 [Rubrivivax sp.]|nr:MAG: hypothetical protein EOP38_10880 [Rubrivivax sp.]